MKHLSRAEARFGNALLTVVFPPPPAPRPVPRQNSRFVDRAYCKKAGNGALEVVNFESDDYELAHKGRSRRKSNGFKLKKQRRPSTIPATDKTYRQSPSSRKSFSERRPSQSRKGKFSSRRWSFSERRP